MKYWRERDHFRRLSTQHSALLFAAACLLVFWACTPTLPETSDGVLSTDIDTAGDTNDNDNVQIPPLVLPDNFDRAGIEVNVFEDVAFPESNILVIDGEITANSQVDVYDLGPFSVGDRIDVQCIASGEVTLDPMCALFDEEGHLAFFNDDENPNSLNFDAFFDGNIRHDSFHWLLAVTASDFEPTVGTYRLRVFVERDVDVEVTQAQTVVLQWEAAEDVIIAGVRYGDLAAFDAATVNADFADQTDQMKDLLLDAVREDFADYNVHIITSDDETPEGNFSTIFFGAASDIDRFGRSDGIDAYNSSDMDNAIVFLAEFSVLSTNFNAVTQAVANITSREIGRTLGLFNTRDDPSVLTDVTGDTNTLLDDQVLGIADLFDFPIGELNPAILLEESVGLAE